jgi:hypothetical protein
LKTWKWKRKSGSFLVTLKWSFWVVFEISMFKTQNHFSSCLTSYDKFRVRSRYIWFFLFDMSRYCLSTLECLQYMWRKKTMCYGFSFLGVFSNFLCALESWSNPS